MQKIVTSPFSQPFDTVQGVLDLALTGPSTKDSDVVESEPSVDPLWIVLPLCVAIIAVLLFVVAIIVFRSVTCFLPPLMAGYCFDYRLFVCLFVCEQNNSTQNISVVLLTCVVVDKGPVKRVVVVVDVTVEGSGA